MNNKKEGQYLSQETNKTTKSEAWRPNYRKNSE